MEQGIAAIFVGVGPGAACTTREVLGIGVPQVTAISDVAAARDEYFAETVATSRSSPTAACGAAARSPRRSRPARSRDARFATRPRRRGARAGARTGDGRAFADAAPRHADQRPHGRLAREDPRSGRRTSRTAPQNLMGALRQSMAALGARDIREMQQVEMVYAPAVADGGEVLAALVTKALARLASKRALIGRGQPVSAKIPLARPARESRDAVKSA